VLEQKKRASNKEYKNKMRYLKRKNIKVKGK
jgi:hypothetical protein